MIVNLITISVVTGFQQKVRQKVSGFGSHILIMSAGESSMHESEPVRKDQPFLDMIRSDAGIRTVQPVGYKPVLFQSEEQETTYKLSNGKDTTEWSYQVQGAVIKGVEPTYDWDFFKQHLKEGKLPDFHQDTCQNHVVISRRLAADLGYEVGQDVSAFFVRNSPVKRKFKVTGIYETGLEEFDRQIVIGSLKTVQELNDWGIQASIIVADTLINGNLVVKAEASGGNGNYRYDWGNGFETYLGFPICPVRDTTIRLIISDYWTDIRAGVEETTLPDTAYLDIHVEKSNGLPCSFQLDELDELPREIIREDGMTFAVEDDGNRFVFTRRDGKGSSHAYAGGFEITVNHWDDLEETLDRTHRTVAMTITPYDELLQTSSIMENQPDIFMWLGFLDVNVIIILTLMVVIGIINMGSALLVLILIRSNFIGIMKAMGSTNWSIRKIFLIQAAFLIGRGMIWGNIIGVGLCLIQQYSGIISLNPEVYYLNQVPIQLDWVHWLLLNLGTLLVCISALIIPSVVITRIDPVKAIKFNS